MTAKQTHIPVEGVCFSGYDVKNVFFSLPALRSEILVGIRALVSPDGGSATSDFRTARPSLLGFPSS